MEPEKYQHRSESRPFPIPVFLVIPAAFVIILGSLLGYFFHARRTEGVAMLAPPKAILQLILGRVYVQ